MNFLTNWIFWIIVVLIVFILTIIGYLSESRKKSKKESEDKGIEAGNAPTASEPTIQNNSAQKPADVNTEAVVDEWSSMPEINSSTVSSSRIVSNSSLDSSVFSSDDSVPVSEPVKEISPSSATPMPADSQPIATAEPMPATSQTVNPQPVSDVQQPNNTDLL